MKHFRTYLPLLLVAFSLTGCVGRFLADGEHVLHDIESDVRMADGSAVSAEVADALHNSTRYYAQRPNSKVLGIKWLPVGKWIYCASGTSSNIWNNYMHRLGQAPVVYEEQRARQTANQLARLLDSKGCFGSTVSFDTIKTDGHNIHIGYHIVATRRYIVDEIAYHTSNDTVRRLLDEWRTDSPLKAGQPYDQDKIAAERSRIVSNLRESGYYHATPNLVTFTVDTTYSNRMLSIDVYVDSRNLHVYHINNIYVYPNSTAGLYDTGRVAGQGAYDTLIYTYPGATRRIDYQFVYDKPMSIRPQTISRALMLFPGMTYRPRYISNSYNSLLSLRNFRYINIDFSESPSSTDTLPLVDAHVRLINADQQQLSLSAELTNGFAAGSLDSSYSLFSSGNFGVETSVEYQHKNIFGGAELLRVKGSLLVELPKLILRQGGEDFYSSFNTFETSLEVSLDMPVFLLPLAGNIVWQRTRPHTLFNIGGSYQYRYFYERILSNTSFGYTWNHSRRASNQVLPIEMTFVRILNMDMGFVERLSSVNDLRLKYQYSSHFILDSRYDYTYSNQMFGSRQDFTNLRLSLESAGNLLAAAAHMADAPTDSNGVRQVFGVQFAQYVRGSAEFVRYHYIGDRGSLVARILLGVGLPYGNSLSMPYEKSFFGGGPSTLRAWQLRHLGPGSYEGSGDMFERIGDMQFVANLEGRFPIAGIFEGALFADLGNIWLMNPSDEYPGGELQPRNLLRQLAIGVGLGVRMNVSIAVLRVDFAIPLVDPGYPSDLRFRPPHWQLNQIVTNLGINYPF